LNVVRLSNEPGPRAALRERLKSAGCAVNEALSDWMKPDAGGDFDSAIVPWEPLRLEDQGEAADAVGEPPDESLFL
jgi:hypothetical protein